MAETDVRNKMLTNEMGEMYVGKSGGIDCTCCCGSCRSILYRIQKKAKTDSIKKKKVQEKIHNFIINFYDFICCWNCVL